MEDNLEVQDSLNTESDQDTTLENGSEESQEDVSKLRDYGKNQKIRAEKAEQELKALKSKLSETKESETPKNEKSDEPDYAKLAFLKSNQVEHPDDQKIVMDEAARLKLPLTDILGMEHIKAKLKDSKDQREAQSGMPKGKGRAGGNTQGDVDYWLANGKTPDELELAEKVINARMKQDSSQKMFSDELF